MWLGLKITFKLFKTLQNSKWHTETTRITIIDRNTDALIPTTVAPPTLVVGRLLS